MASIEEFLDSTRQAMDESKTTCYDEKELPSSEEIIEKSLGTFGFIEFLQCLLVSFAMFFDAQQSFITIYTDNYPTWHCIDPSNCTTNSNICKIPNSSWSWDGPIHMTIISQWGLQCTSNFITGLPQSSFFIGCLIGSFVLATLADTSFGRKNMLIFSCLSMSITSILIVFSTNVWIYSAFKFLIGIWRSSIGTCVLVLITERVSREWRFRVGVVEYFCFTLGYISLPEIAYINRKNSWKILYLWSAIPGVCYSIIGYVFVTESPRWLVMQGRNQEAIAMLKGISSAEESENLTKSLLKKYSPREQKGLFFNVYASVAEIFKRSWALKRVLTIMVLGIGIGMVYFGMPLAVGNLGFNIYLVVAFNALMEIPSCVATYFLENRRRKPSIFAFAMASGVSCVMCVIVGAKGVKVGLALVSFFSACTAYNVFLIYIIELFPTSVRNTTTSLVRQAIVFGNIFSPFLISAGRENDIFSYGVFGVVIICSCVTLLGLPETKGLALCDTMDQQEKKEYTSM